MRFGFDTSGLNRLYDDSDSDALITALLAKGEFWISAYNVFEAAKSKDEVRRHGLVGMMGRLAENRPPLIAPNMLVRAVARAYAEAGPGGVPTFKANNDPELENIWAVMHEPELLDDEARDEALAWAAKLESDYDEIAVGARERFQTVFDSMPNERPRTAARTLRGFMSNKEKIFTALVAPIYERETGRALSHAEYERMTAEPALALYFGGYAYALHNRSVKRERYSRSLNAGGIDLGQAVYLRLVDQFVTADRAQYRGLRFLSRLAQAANYNVEVLTYDAFRRRLLSFG
jgi:hypothetical protein